MKHVDKLAFDAALSDMWATTDADPDVIFARQGLAIVPIDKVRNAAVDAELLSFFVDELTGDAGLTCQVKERINGPEFTAIDVEDIRRFADDFFDE
jgi:hypothetical protein